MNEGRGRGKANGKALLASGKIEPQADSTDITTSNMGRDRYTIRVGYTIITSDRIFGTHMGATLTQTIFLLMVFYLILGYFLETLSMMIATIPVVVPVVVHLGLDSVGFGIFLVLMMEIALFTPPMGMNLYVVQGVRGGGPMRDVVIGTFPFLLVMIAFVVNIILFPGITLWIPRKMFG